MGQKSNFKHGGRKVSEFYSTMKERHAIYLLRQRGTISAPWTDDPIFRDYKFCNVFRQLDRGTVALREMIPNNGSDWLRLWNVVWYRLFNYRGNAKWFESPKDLRLHITKRWGNDDTIFTDAHMTTGREGELKHETMLETIDEVFDVAPILWREAQSTASMEAVFHLLKEFYGIGAFVSYEIVCDLRFILRYFLPTDKMTWANVGPGAKRGMQRLGLEPTFDTMIQLMDDAPKLECEWPFELREIEHWLCEFDKYCRISDGGTKRMRRYRG